MRTLWQKQSGFVFDGFENASPADKQKPMWGALEAEIDGVFSSVSKIRPRKSAPFGLREFCRRHS
jgi:hypothetical protein